jgi:hypothetical protein
VREIDAPPSMRLRGESPPAHLQISSSALSASAVQPPFSTSVPPTPLPLRSQSFFRDGGATPRNTPYSHRISNPRQDPTPTRFIQILASFAPVAWELVHDLLFIFSRALPQRALLRRDWFLPLFSSTQDDARAREAGGSTSTLLPQTRTVGTRASTQLTPPSRRALPSANRPERRGHTM